MNTLQVLADPIQSAINTNQKYYVIAKQCMVEAGHKGQLKGEVKAVRVLCSRNGKIPPKAFSFCTEIRHVLVENGVKIVGEAARRCCRQLQIVHLPDAVVGLLHGAFSKCQVLPYSGRPKLQVLRHQGIRRVLLLNAGWRGTLP